MAFVEALKLEVKKKAHFKCCICESFSFLQIHHIIPEVECGPDNLDNAVPLCVNCHDTYGANPDKRKWIKEKRDFWYDQCENMLSNENTILLEKTYKIIEQRQKQDEERIKNAEQDIKILQQTVLQLTNQNQELISSLDQTTPEGKPNTFAQIGSISKTLSGTTAAIAQIGRGVSGALCPACGQSNLIYTQSGERCFKCGWRP